MQSTPEPLHIKKYPNRRFYDATRSRHVTLQEVYEVILSGRDVVITDSRNDEDITNVVLLQIMLEHDLAKLSVFPASILHLMLRSNQQVVRQSFNRFFEPFISILAQSQKQFDEYIRQTMRGPLGAPMSWTNTMMQAFAPHRSVEPDTINHDPDSQDAASALDDTSELRAQLEELTRKVEELGKSRHRATAPEKNNANAK